MARRPAAVTEDREASKRVGALTALWPFIRPYRVMVMLAGLALTTTATVSLVLPMAVRRVVDGFNAGAELLDSYFAAALLIAGAAGARHRGALLPCHPARRAGGRRHPPRGLRPGDRA